MGSKGPEGTHARTLSLYISRLVTSSCPLVSVFVIENIADGFAVNTSHSRQIRRAMPMLLVLLSQPPNSGVVHYSARMLFASLACEIVSTSSYRISGILFPSAVVNMLWIDTSPVITGVAALQALLRGPVDLFHDPPVSQ